MIALLIQIIQTVDILFRQLIFSSCCLSHIQKYARHLNQKVQVSNKFAEQFYLSASFCNKNISAWLCRCSKTMFIRSSCRSCCCCILAVFGCSSNLSSCFFPRFNLPSASLTSFSICSCCFFNAASSKSWHQDKSMV